MRKNMALPLAFLLLCGLFTGCGGPDKSKEELNLSLGASPQTIDPQLTSDTISSYVISFMAGCLYELDEDMKAIPCLAKDYELSDDGLTYTIHLKENLKWSDGSPLTADDYVCALQRLADPDIGSSAIFLITDSCVIKNAREINSGQLPVNSLGVSSPDLNTLVVELEQPCPYFLNLLTNCAFSPCSDVFYHSMGDNYAKSAKTILSSGPYILDKYAPLATQIHFTKNPHYVFADKITLPGITIQVVPNQQQALMCYDAGMIDVTKVSGGLLELTSDDDDLHVFPLAVLQYLVVNQKANPVLQNLKIRYALSKSIDRESIVKNILRQGYWSMTRVIPKGSYTESNGKDFSEDSTKFDALAGYQPSEARKLWEEGLAEEGIKNTTLRLIYPSSQNNMMEAISAQLEENLPGLKISKKIVSSKELMQTMKNGAFDLLPYGWLADYSDPTAFLGLFLSSGSSYYSNPEYDALYNLAQTAEYTQNPPKRDALLHQLEDLVMEDMGLIPLLTSGEACLINDKVKGYHMNSVNGSCIVSAISKEVEK